jgi:hypothetical protein
MKKSKAARRAQKPAKHHRLFIYLFRSNNQSVQQPENHFSSLAYFPLGAQAKKVNNMLTFSHLSWFWFMVMAAG